MSVELLSFVLGGFLVAVGLLGGGIEVRELKVPSVGRITRVLSFAAGMAFVGLAVFLGPGQVKDSAAVNAEPAALVRVTFAQPMYGDLRLDACYEWADRCGEEPATAWCQTKGFARAVEFPIENVGNRGLGTRLISTQAECREQFCASFSHITCER
jgi:hypothetical protein